MTVRARHLIPITDDRGKLLVTSPAWSEPEPEPGSVVLVEGQWGQAWQRQFSDGLWYCSTHRGKGRDWAWLLTKRNLLLAYDAAVR